MAMRSCLLGQFKEFQDELLVYFTCILDYKSILNLGLTNSVFGVICAEEPLWMYLILRDKKSNFYRKQLWKQTYFWPEEDKIPMAFRQRTSPGFSSDFLYRRWLRCNLQLNAFIPENPKLIDKVEFNQMDLQRFRCYYEATNLPLMLSNAVDNWPASKWTIETLIKKIGDIKFRITHNLDISYTSTFKMTFKEYVEYCKYQCDETPLYIFDPKFGKVAPILLNDFQVKELNLFPDDFFQVLTNKEKQINRPDFQWLVIGPLRSGAPWHVDPAKTSAWNVLLQGKKRWALYPPDHLPPGLKFDEDGTISDVPSMSSLQWYLEVYPLLKESERPLEIIQEPGDLIFIPSGWWHLVINLTTTIALTQNFVNTLNFGNVCKDLLETKEEEVFSCFQKALTVQHPKIKTWFEFIRTREEQDIYTFYEKNNWEKHIQKIIEKHKFNVAFNSSSISVLTERINPVFSIGNLVLKFFSSWNYWGETDGVLVKEFNKEIQVTIVEEAFNNELCFYQQVLQQKKIKNEQPEQEEQEQDTLSTIIPQFLASGRIQTDTDCNTLEWPYIVMENVTEVQSLEKARKESCNNEYKNYEEIINWLSFTFFPSMLSLSLPLELNPFGEKKYTWESYKGFLKRRRIKCKSDHIQWNILPFSLIQQIENYLPSIDSISNLISESSNPVYLHGDLNDENLLVSTQKSKKKNKNSYLPVKVIDFGDSRTGDILYDFIPVYLSIFNADPKAFSSFLNTFGYKWNKTIRYRMMCLTLLHPCNPLNRLATVFPHYLKLSSLEEIEKSLYDF